MRENNPTLHRVTSMFHGTARLEWVKPEELEQHIERVEAQGGRVVIVDGREYEGGKQRA